MEWRKTSLVTALLLLVALIGAITWTDSKNGFSDESQYSIPATRFIFEFYKNIPHFGLEVEFRTNGKPIYGFYPRGAVGKLFTSYAPGRQILRVFAVPTDINTRKYSLGGAAPGYTRYMGVAGYCSRTSVKGSTRFFEFSKWNAVRRRREYAYSYSQDRFDELRRAGYAHWRFLCYIQAHPLPAFKPVVEWSRVKPGFGTEFEYRVSGASVPGFTRGETIGMLARTPANGNKVVRVFGNYAGSMKYSTTSGAPGYVRYFGIAGYCRSTRATGYTAFYELRKGSEYAYSTHGGNYENLRRLGYTSPKLLCYIKEAPITWVRIRRFVKLVRPHMYFEVAKVGSPNPPGYADKGLIPIVLAGRPYPGSRPIRIFYNPSTKDSILYTYGRMKTGYSVYRGILGYCSGNRRTGEVPIKKYGRYLSDGSPIDNAYAVTSGIGITLMKSGFKDEGVLCYARWSR